jgi:hypothetical protein
MPRLMLPEAHVIWACGARARELPVTDVDRRKYFNRFNKQSPVCRRWKFEYPVHARDVRAPG